MNWLRKIRGSLPEKDERILLNHKRLKFQQLLRNYGRVIDLVADAAEKQGGGFVLDRQYIVSLAQEVFNLAKAIIFDFMTITGKRVDIFFDLLERFELEGWQVLDSSNFKKDGAGQEPKKVQIKSVPNTEALAQSLARHPILYRDSGQVASWGVAAGPVFNLKTDKDVENFPDGGIWVSPDLMQAVELSRVIGRARAILADEGDPAGYVCRMVRNDRIPTVVGLRNATERLKTGEVITVDADENTIYQGLIPELLEHYRKHAEAGPEEELEYQILRKFRRTVFPLTIHSVRDRLPDSRDVNTLHDLIHLAHELAGEVLAGMAITARNAKKISEHSASQSYLVLAYVLGEEIKALDDSQSNTDSVSSLPLEAFCAGLQDFENKTRQEPRKKDDMRIIALINKQEATLVMPCFKGFDMIDVVMSGNEPSNYIYCRFDSMFHDMDQRFVRQDAAIDILTRMNFAAAVTNRAVTTWITRREKSEVEKQMKILGRLWGFLKEGDRVGWRREKLAIQIEDFMQNHIS